jgi:glycosyltransferase involved in cell wall biosynthesis
MKLLFILPEYGPNVGGGIATYYRNLFPSLIRTGCKIEVCIGGQPEIAPIEHGLSIASIDSALIDREFRRLSQFSATPALRSALATAFACWERCNQGQGYDVVEVTDWGLLYVPWLLHRNGPKVVVQFHGSKGQVDFHDPFEGNELTGLTTRLLETALLGRADELQSYGSANASEWSDLLGRPVQVIRPAWNSMQTQPPVSPRPEFGLIVGRIQSWKGPDVVCKAIALLGDAAPEIRWIGRDHPYRRLDKSYSSLLKEVYPAIWAQKIVPLGEKSAKETAELQASASFVVVPSTWDTFNLSAVEAMAAGNVLICSEGAGAAALIQHGENGFTFPSGDATKLAELIRMVGALSAKERHAIGRRAQETVEHEMCGDRIASVRMKRFEQLVTASATGRGEHPWLNTVFAASLAQRPFDFLTDIPLRELIRHVIRRCIDRLRRSLR